MSSQIKGENEYQIFGIPGAGKTTTLSQAVSNAANQVGGNNLIVSSFTRAAAQELVSRELPVPDNNVGTLHSLCYRALGTPELAEKNIRKFNEEYPECGLTPKAHVDLDDVATDDEEGVEGESDAWFQEYKLSRAKLTPREKWKPQVTHFASKWEAWKEENGYIDFTDMIEYALHELPYPPGAPQIGIFDEAQDFTPLQLKLIRTWANQLQYILIAGDDDQSLFSFTGADPDVLTKADVPQERKRILSQSFRVPRIIQEHAQRWIEKITDREPKEQYPRQQDGEYVEGSIERLPAHYKEAEKVVDQVERSLSELASNQEVMVLTSCSYMLTPAIKELRRRGIPFGNRYKRRRGDWNPLRTGQKSTSSAARVLAYLQPEGPKFRGHTLWTSGQLAKWIELCNSKGLLQQGAKKRIQEAASEELSKKGLFELIGNSFIPEKLDEAVQLDLDWLYRHLTSTKASSIEFPFAVIKKRGAEELKKEPRVLVGTIHSVKGGQADHVILFPDISYRGAQYAECRKGRDDTIRQFYVGMTRAREKLIIGDPRTQLHIPI